MARKSRCRNLSEPAGKTKSAGAKLTGAINRTAIYIRLSLCDDIYFPKEDSIQTQLHMLREYVAKRSDLHYVTEYIDRGWTGANFQRPGFLQMIEDIQAGKINCIVVKDLSRFGRNYWETGYFLEVLLPQLKTRFISVVDGFDNYTSAPDALAIILKNIMNDFYSRDISRRLSDTVDLKNANAIYWGKQPYGYLSNPKQSFRLVFDPEVSYYVRLIFDWVLEGTPIHTISKRLNEMKIPNASKVYYLRSGGKTKRKGGTHWFDVTLVEMLRNRAYAGDFVCNKSYDRKCDPFHVYRHVPKEDWIIIPNTHPAYISHEEYEQINQHLDDELSAQKQRFQDNAPFRAEYPNLYKGKIHCPICGRKMTLNSNYTRSIQSMYYACCFRGKANEAAHKSTTIQKHTLDVMVLYQLQEQCRLSEILSQWLRSPEGKRRVRNLFLEYENSIRRSNQRIDALKAERASLFELHAEYLIDQETYTEKMERLREDLRQASVDMEAAAKHLSEQKKAISTENPWLKLFSALPFPDTMTMELVETTIDHIDMITANDADVVFLHREWFLKLWTVYQEGTHEERC